MSSEKEPPGIYAMKFLYQGALNLKLQIQIQKVYTKQYISTLYVLSEPTKE